MTDGLWWKFLQDTVDMARYLEQYKAKSDPDLTFEVNVMLYDEKIATIRYDSDQEAYTIER